VKADRKAIEKQLDANVKGVVEKLKRPEAGHCKECKHFDGAFHPSFPTYGQCRLVASTYTGADHPESLAVTVGWPQYESGLLVSPDFGCIQFEPKEPQ